MLPWAPYPTQPHDHQYYGAPHDGGPYVFPAAPYAGENADGPYDAQASTYPYGMQSQPQPPHGYLQNAENQQVWPRDSATPPVDNSSPFYGSSIPGYQQTNQQYGEWQQSDESVQRSKKGSLIDPQLYYGDAPESSILTRDLQYNNTMLHSAPAHYAQSHLNMHQPVVPRLELFDPTRTQAPFQSVTSPTESTYSELRYALSESPVSSPGAQEHDRTSRSPSFYHDLPAAFPRAINSPSSELTHALDESHIGRASPPWLVSSSSSTPAPAAAATPATLDQHAPMAHADEMTSMTPPAEDVHRPSSPPMDHLPWPTEVTERTPVSPTPPAPASPIAPPSPPPAPRSRARAKRQPRQPRAQVQSAVPLASAFQFVQDGAVPFHQAQQSTQLPFPLTAATGGRTSTDDLIVASRPASAAAQERERSPPSELVHRTPSSKPRKRPRKKPTLACLFCRQRKIACGPPVAGSDNPSCNQCASRNRPCEYPPASRRGQYKRLAALAEREEDEEHDHDHDHDHEHDIRNNHSRDRDRDQDRDGQPVASTSRG
ncbi:hypothetical protein DENSPDRAFT_852828 [Dentipellis sp. KUC8613]|nr:hypothetical protein DENSPDRAFT_852828 [Dentipellis sp. KUC8613]